MAEAVAEAIAGNSVLVAEAGTGTGKTYAYLVPALLSGGKVIVSTGTKKLQDQLFDRDIPTVRRALNAPVTVALLKGRANYVCHYHLERTLQDGRLRVRDDARYLREIAALRATSKSGDKGGCRRCPRTPPVWPFVTSTRDNCLGAECPRYEDCFVMEARRRRSPPTWWSSTITCSSPIWCCATRASPSCCPRATRSSSTRRISCPIPRRLFFGQSVSTSQLIELARDTRLEARASAADFAALPERRRRSRRPRATCACAWRKAAACRKRRRCGAERNSRRAANASREKLDGLTAAARGASRAQRRLRECGERGEALASALDGWRERRATRGCAGSRFSPRVQLQQQRRCRSRRSSSRQIAGPPRAWMFTSATLSVNGDFGTTVRDGPEEARRRDLGESVRL